MGAIPMQPGRDLRCSVAGCGAMMRPDVVDGRNVDVCPACEKRRKAFPLAFRPMRCRVCENPVQRTATKGTVPRLCPACKTASAVHRKALKRDAEEAPANRVRAIK